MRIFRVQDYDGRGPFRPGFSRVWSDATFAPGSKSLPTFMEEFGNDVIDRNGRPGEFYGSGVRRVEQICDWFSETERTKLAALGYNIVSLRVPRILGESNHQILFARNRPLAEGAIIIPWCELDRLAA